MTDSLNTPSDSISPALSAPVSDHHRAPYTGAPMGAFSAQRGDLVSLRNWKWDGSAHWVLPARYLGADAHGHWFYQKPGDFLSRPGHALYLTTSALILIPTQENWIATFHGQEVPGSTQLYIDLVWDVSFRALGRDPGWEINSLDMDLDVIRLRSGTVFIDDEDEFEEHQRRMHYPSSVIRELETLAQQLKDRVSARTDPFSQTAQYHWERIASTPPPTT